VTRAQPAAVDGGKPRVTQPDKMVKQRRRMIGVVWKAEMVPARVDETLKEFRRAERVRLLVRPVQGPALQARRQGALSLPKITRSR